MKKSIKYDTTGISEDEYVPGSNGTVLKNLLEIKTKKEIDIVESQLLKIAQNQIIRLFPSNHTFSADDILKINKIWLEKLYPWAGQYRKVNMTKGNFLFAPSSQVSRLMEEFEEKILKIYTPCTFKKNKEIVKALAETHVELQIIHPFREGNGRTSRMLASHMALQAGLPLLDFSIIKDELKNKYISAIQIGMGMNYKLMEEIFEELIEKSHF